MVKKKPGKKKAVKKTIAKEKSSGQSGKKIPSQKEGRQKTA